MESVAYTCTQKAGQTHSCTIGGNEAKNPEQNDTKSVTGGTSTTACSTSNYCNSYNYVPTVSGCVQ